jgi:hypothetical protein
VIGAISQADVLEAKTEKVSSADMYDTYGSGWYDNIKNAITKAIPMVQSAARIAHSGLNAAKSAGLLGEGVHSGGSAMSGGELSFYGGSAMSGGAKLSRKDLAARLR